MYHVLAILFIAFIIFILITLVVWSLYNGISPMPTSRKAKRCLLSALPEKCNGKIYELGSGWGTLLFPLAKRYPDHQIIGFETSPLPFLFSQLRCLFGRYKNVHIVRKNFFCESLVDAGVIVCYLYPGAMARLKSKLTAELQSGAWVISNTFSIPGWLAYQVYEVGDIYYSKVFVYKFP